MSAMLEYELGWEDIEAFFAYHADHAPEIRTRNRVMRLVWAGLFVLLAVAYPFQTVGARVILLVLGAIVLVFYPRLNRWGFVRHCRRLNAEPDGPRLGRMRLELAGGQLLIDAPECSSRLELSAIRRIGESGSHYFLYLGPISAVILPKIGDQAERFVEALRSALPAD